MIIKNEFNQPIGQPLKEWKPSKFPSTNKIVGFYCELDILNPNLHGDLLFKAFLMDDSGWTYLPYGPFNTYEEFYQWLEKMANKPDPFFYTIIDKKSGHPLGVLSYSRINPENGTIEIAHIHFSKNLRKTATATEAIYLLIEHAFDVLHVRRCEWKCDSLNQASKRAAERLGFQFEGIFRQDRIYKERNRDTAWYSIIDSEWDALKARFKKWLNPENFDRNSYQLLKL